MLTRSGLGNVYVLCLQSNEAGATRVGAKHSIYHGVLAFVLALVLWLVAVDVAGAASGTPWHAQTDSLTGEALPVWELWFNAIDSETWADDLQVWVTSNLPWLVAPHPTTANSGLAASSLGVHRTTDGGETWAHLPGIVDSVIAIAYNTQNAQIVYAGTELGGTYRSEDGGLYWRSINTGLPSDRLGHVAGAVHIATDPTQSDTLFAATTTAGGLYRSQDDGANWHLANSGLPEESILGLAVTESGSTRLYAAAPSGLYLSNNRAQDWSLIGALPIETPQQLLVEPNALGNLLLVAEDAIYRSTNAGVTWIVLDIPAEMSPIRDVMFATSGERALLLVAGESGPYWQWFTPATPQSPPQAESEDATYSEITGHTIREPFLSYFNAHGGVVRFGYPRTDAISEDGKTVQYFQRSRLEIGTDEDGDRVVQGPISSILRSGGTSTASATQSDSNSTQAQYAVDQVFVSYYTNNNGGVAFGSPIAPAADEVQVNGVTLYTQYFEFARLEHHPGATTPVLLGLIGDEYLTQKGWLE